MVLQRKGGRTGVGRVVRLRLVLAVAQRWSSGVVVVKRRVVRPCVVASQKKGGRTRMVRVVRLQLVWEVAQRWSSGLVEVVRWQ